MKEVFQCSLFRMERGGIVTICESTAASPMIGTTPEAEVPRERVESRSALNSITTIISNIFKKDKPQQPGSPQAKKKQPSGGSGSGSRVGSPERTEADGVEGPNKGELQRR